MKKVKIGLLLIWLCLWIGAPEVLAEEQEESVPTIEETEPLDQQSMVGPATNELYAITPSEVERLLNQVALNKLLPEISAALNQTTEKLGYLVGDTLKITLPSSLFAIERKEPTFFTEVGGSENGFKGRIWLTDFSISTGSSTSVNINYLSSGDVEVEFTRVAHIAAHGNVLFRAKVAYAIDYYNMSGSALNPIPKGKYEGTNSALENIEFSLPFLKANIPDFVVSQNDQSTQLTLGEKFDYSDPLKYVNVLSCPGKPEAKYSEESEFIPDTSRMGKTKAQVILTDVYTRKRYVTIEFTVVDKIIATTQPQTLALGTRVKDLPYHEWVKDVRLEKSNISLELGSAGEDNRYQVSLKNPEQVIDTTDAQTVPVVITSGEASAEFSIPVSVEIGTSLFVNNSSNQTIFSLSMLPNGDGTYRLSSSKGRPSEAGNQINNNIELAVSNHGSSPVKLDQLGWNAQYSFDDGEDISSSYQKIEVTTVHLGDVVRLTNSEMAQIDTPFEMYQNGVSIGYDKPTPLIKPTIYFVVTESGFEPLQLNQLQVFDGNSLDLYQTETEIAAQVTHYIQNDYQDKGVIVMGFDSYPNTQQPGLTTGSLLVKQAKNGTDYQFSYSVEAIVKEGALTFSVPATFDFGSYALGSDDVIVQRDSLADETVTVVDNRQNDNKTQWNLVAKITNAADGLGKYVIYVDKENAEYYFTNGQSVPILESSQDGQVGKVISTETWDKSEGVLLKIPKRNELEAKSYKTQIEWTITLGGEL